MSLASLKWITPLMNPTATKAHRIHFTGLGISRCPSMLTVLRWWFGHGVGRAVGRMIVGAVGKVICRSGTLSTMFSVVSWFHCNQLVTVSQAFATQAGDQIGAPCPRYFHTPRRNPRVIRKTRTRPAMRLPVVALRLLSHVLLLPVADRCCCVFAAGVRVPREGVAVVGFQNRIPKLPMVLRSFLGTVRVLVVRRH